jgi:hypothetical protein
MNGPIQFAVTVPRGPVAAKDQVVLNLELHNAGPEGLYVNGRFACVPVHGDVRLTVKFKGKEVPFRYRVRLAALGNSDFLLLEPGQRVVAGYLLTKGYDLGRAGAYEVAAEYVSEEVPKELAKEKVFTGRASAAPVQLVVG